MWGSTFRNTWCKPSMVVFTMLPHPGAYGQDWEEEKDREKHTCIYICVVVSLRRTRQKGICGDGWVYPPSVVLLINFVYDPSPHE
jgi:hypothetical protein